MSHKRTLLSQLPEANNLPRVGSKAKQEIGPWWPEKDSINCPVFRLQRKISFVSNVPAATTSPEASTAKLENWTGWGGTNWRKARKRRTSKARTEPSWEAEISTWPCLVNARAVIGPTCSEKTAIHSPPRSPCQSLILPSPAPVAIICPSGA